MSFKVYCQHTHNDKCVPVICGTYNEGVDLVHEHFLSYGFELCNGLAIDPLEEGDNKEVFSDVIISNGKVASFKHHDEDGPVGKVNKDIFISVENFLNEYYVPSNRTRRDLSLENRVRMPF